MNDNKEFTKLGGIRKKKSIISTALELLSVRDRSIKEMRSALIKKSYEAEEVEEALLQLIDEGYLDDQKTANFWANCLFDTGQYGIYGITRKLIERGIPEDLSMSASEMAYEGNDEVDLAFVVAKKRWPKKKDPQSAARLVSNYLMRHGFSRQTIYKVLRQMGEEISDIT